MNHIFTEYSNKEKKNTKKKKLRQSHAVWAKVCVYLHAWIQMWTKCILIHTHLCVPGVCTVYFLWCCMHFFSFVKAQRPAKRLKCLPTYTILHKALATKKKYAWARTSPDHTLRMWSCRRRGVFMRGAKVLRIDNFVCSLGVSQHFAVFTCTDIFSSDWFYVIVSF